MLRLMILVKLIVIHIFFTKLSDGSCVVENGTIVPFYLFLKVPKLSNWAGNELLVFSPNSPNKFSQDFYNVENRSNGTLQETLNSIKFTNRSLLLVYSDQPSSGKEVSENYAHSKGILYYDFGEEKGFWLMHSIPHFIDIDPSNYSYNYPKSGKEYGQNGLCLSLDHQPTHLNVLFQHLYIIHCNIDQKFIGKSISINFDKYFQSIITKHSDLPRPSYLINELDEFHLISKNKLFHFDIYQLFFNITQQFSSFPILFVESWRNGKGNFNSSCYEPNHKIIEIDSLHFTNLPKLSYSTHHDHSKWAVSDQTNHICFADMNRQMEQLNRGGGMICWRNEFLSDLFHNSIELIDACELR
ncbi:hypothetical protein SNEBB_010543 [Seison nebaliae]|nr:hypothetical protein SNEBB_010543 [Seison nebaliae]